MSSTLVKNIIKSDFIDPASRLFTLIDNYTVVLDRQFLSMISGIKDSFTIKEIESLIEAGRIGEAFKIIESHAEKFANQINMAFIESARDTASTLESIAVVSFDQANYQAVNIMRQNKLNLVREFLEGQRNAVRQVMTRGISQGLNPRVQAKAFVDSIGLTARQEVAVANYRTLLERNSADVLTRQLRDRRFDRTISRAIENKTPLTSEQINKMTDRYREKYLKYRSETIARTESLSAVNEGSDAMYQQAIENGTLDPKNLEKAWQVRLDGKQRDSHDPMNGQVRNIDEPFITGAGNYIMYPGDRNAPAEERVHCRCAKTVRIKGV